MAGAHWAAPACVRNMPAVGMLAIFEEGDEAASRAPSRGGSASTAVGGESQGMSAYSHSRPGSGESDFTRSNSNDEYYSRGNEDYLRGDGGHQGSILEWVDPNPDADIATLEEELAILSKKNHWQRCASGTRRVEALE